MGTLISIARIVVVLVLLTVAIAAAGYAQASNGDEVQGGPYADILIDCGAPTSARLAGERDTLLDLESGVLVVTTGIGEQTTFALLLGDPECTNHAEYGALIEHVLAAAMEDLASECDWLVAAIESGEVIDYRHMSPIKIDIEKAKAHVLRWCQP